MLRRQPYIPLFSSCCTPKSSQKEEAGSFQQGSLNKQKKENKFSLKQLRNKSNESTISIFDRNSTPKQPQHALDTPFKSRQLLLSRQFQPPNKFHNHCDNKKTSLVKTALKKTTKKRADLVNIQIQKKQAACLEDFGLQKTALINSPKPKAINKFNNNYFPAVEQLKLPVKKNILSTIMTSKNNVISINNIEYEPACQKYEQSLIMIDFFNPPTQKAHELEQYLQKQ